ncbi:Rrf2 family transcriptional regulator [Anaerovorax odorimutans]|uniref:Rrf2 family transcriptional regulator n=1 Tax=Anaerovorax odorimutans TaxID=109327 RepID=A0ABT1RPX4_9FIRM|nr:Rrf2 family transcriptional regulator [Anaerovorax odorimutans]MCQ4636926.1 Rrf2 family transcriptional regulator [Anaerovorax odorimutans]
MTSEFAIAVHTLVFLNHKGDCQSSEKIAENVCTNPARVRKILVKLRKAGLVRTKEGNGGGYYFQGEAENATLAQICEAVEEVPITVSKKTGDPDMNCQIASGMAGIMDEIYEEMNGLCIKQLEGITLADIDRKVFEK